MQVNLVIFCARSKVINIAPSLQGLSRDFINVALHKRDAGTCATHDLSLVVAQRLPSSER